MVELDKMELLKKIEEKRIEMENIAEQYGYKSKEVLESSEELDILIAHFQKLD